jgi:cell division protein FtsZ
MDIGMFEVQDMISGDQAVETNIKVVGVGGAGGNAINRMIASGLKKVTFVAMNTDMQALQRSNASTRLTLGKALTEGLGAGGIPEIGEKAALESKEDIKAELEDADMVFVTAGMGGGTGTGAAPIVAEVARSLSALTVGVVTTPFSFEGKKKLALAEAGIAKLREQVDTLIIIPNQYLLNVVENNTPIKQAFLMADEVLYMGVQGISELITEPGEINIDFADVRTVMTEAGTTAVMGIGIATGDERSEEAVEQAISCPLLEDVDLSNARGVLVHIVSGIDFTWDEYETVGDALKEFASDDSQIIIGVTVNPLIDTGELHVTVIVTGLGERKSEVSATKKSTMSSESGISNALKEALVDANEQSADKSNAPVESEGSYLDIPAFLRKQAD